MSTFNTIHIFGFGVVQVIGKDFNIQVPITEVQTEANACIDNVWSAKPLTNTSTKEYHAINIFNGMFADWQSKIKGEKGYRANSGELDFRIFENLVTAVKNTQQQ